LLRYKLRAAFKYRTMRAQMPLVRFRGGIATDASRQDRRNQSGPTDSRTHHWLDHIGDFGPP
jgi:hypothetical protein